MQARLRRYNLKLVLAFFGALAALVAQDSTSYLTPDVIRVGGRLACRCGGCRNTVGDCPMLHCSSADPLRHRIYSEKGKGVGDDAIVNQIVREEGIVALASPPVEGLGPIITWVMPGLILVLGFFIYSRFVRRNRKPAAPISEGDQALMERFREHLDVDSEDDQAHGPLSNKLRS